MTGLTLLGRVVAWELLVAASAYILLAAATSLSPRRSPQVGFFALGFTLMALAMAARFAAAVTPAPFSWRLAIPSGALTFMSAAAFLSGFAEPSTRPVVEAGVIATGIAVLAVVGNDPTGLPLVELCYGAVFLVPFALGARVYLRSGLATHLLLALGFLLIGISGLLAAAPLALPIRIQLFMTASLHLGAALSFVWALAGV